MIDYVGEFTVEAFGLFGQVRFERTSAWDGVFLTFTEIIGQGPKRRVPFGQL